MHFSFHFYELSSMKSIAKLTSVLVVASFSTLALAQTVEIKDAWARSTVQGQKATGAFMKLTAKEGAKLVGGSSPAAGVVEVHEMKMEGDVMKMRAVRGGLDLPAGKAVELKPGGYHVMLMDLKAPLAKDSTVPLTLVFTDGTGVESKVELKVPVSTMAPGGAMPMDHSQHKM
jgi:copper(I)-binding protein